MQAKNDENYPSNYRKSVLKFLILEYLSNICQNGIKIEFKFKIILINIS